MKKVVRKIVSMALACMLIWVIPISAHAETTESIIMDEGTENTMELIGQEVVHIKYDGTIVHELIYTKLQNKKLLYASQSDKVTCSYAYYYLGSEFDSEVTINDEDDAVYKGAVQIREVEKDGSKVSILYSADEGAVFDMEMIDGILYFTTWKYHDGFKLNQYQLDCTLYSYDLRWRRLRVLLSYEGDAEHDNSTLHILNNKNKEKIYLTYGYKDSQRNRHTILLTYNIETHKDEIVADNLNTEYGKSFNIISTASGIYIETKELDNGVEWTVIYSCDADLQNQKEIFRIVDGDIYCMDRYLYAINTDYNKFFYQCDTGTVYLANTCFTEEGTYISDIYGLDESSDKIYIDGHDYTGMKPGDVITSDQSEQTVTGWTEFRDTYFTKLENADQNTVEAFDWVKWPEE